MEELKITHTFMVDKVKEFLITKENGNWKESKARVSGLHEHGADLIMVGGKKTAAGANRRVPIHKSIFPFVERLMQTDGEYLIMRYDKGKPQKLPYQRFLQYNWNPLMERLDMKDYTPHYGRHTCATMLREAGVEEDLRKLILGHANGDITDRYTHHPDYMLIEAIDKLPGR